MPRTPREFSITNVYHIIFRGNDKQNIFYDDQDRYVFLDRIKESQEKFKYEVYAYCLMSNHVHLVIRVKDEFLSKAMHNLGTRYSVYLNKKLERTGHVFENRYFSRSVENLNYFKEVCKYVHRNPEKAGIQKTENYKWSSFHDYLNVKDNRINRKVLLHYFDDNIQKLKRFTLINDDKDRMLQIADFEMLNKIEENDFIEIIKEKYNVTNASDISLLEDDKLKKIICELLNANGGNINQISRITKVTRYRINKLLE